MIFIFLANTIASQYFPAQYPINSLLAFFGTFAVGYLARPLGGLLFGHFGDVCGRQKTFYYSMLLMAVPSLLIALLPTYSTLGVVAPSLLVLVRLIQGIAIGGEIPGAITFIFEHTHRKVHGRTIVLIFFSLSLAILFGQGMVALLHKLLSQSAFHAWGWRLAFLFGFMLAIVAAYLRSHLSETPVFTQINIEKRKGRWPCISLMRYDSLPLLQGTSMVCLGAVGMMLLFVYMPTYMLILGHRCLSKSIRCIYLS